MYFTQIDKWEKNNSATRKTIVNQFRHDTLNSTRYLQLRYYLATSENRFQFVFYSITPNTVTHAEKQFPVIMFDKEIGILELFNPRLR